VTGRPTEYTPEKGDAICALLAEGKSLRAICAQEGMPAMSSVLLWVVKGARNHEIYKAFSEQYRDAREAQAELFGDELIDISDEESLTSRRAEDGETVCFDNVQRSKLRVDTRKWVMSKLLPKKYGEKVTLAGDKDNPIEISDAKSALLRGVVPNATSGGADQADK
jgi:hypothetical protein